MALTPPVIGEFFQGQPFQVPFEFRDKAGTLYDAASPTMIFYNDNTGTLRRLAGGDFTHEGTGRYLATTALSEAGEWSLRVYDDVDLGDSAPYIILIAEDKAYGR